MKTTTMRQRLHRAVLALSTALWLSGCGAGEARESVAVSAINYTDRDLNAFLFINPETNAPAGGTGLSPYEGGGTMCCYALPRHWRPGIRVKLRYDWWTGSSLERNYQYLEVELPRYEGTPGMLWALFYPDGEVEVIASAVDPGHPEWAGREPGWPVPSRAYRLRLWEAEMERLRFSESDYTASVEDTSPEALLETWRHAEKYRPQDIQDFSGPDDPRFIEYKVQRFERAVERTRQWIRELEARKP